MKDTFNGKKLHRVNISAAVPARTIAALWSLPTLLEKKDIQIRREFLCTHAAITISIFVDHQNPKVAAEEIQITLTQLPSKEPEKE